MKPIKAIAMGPMLVVVLLTGCGGDDGGGSDSSSDESGTVIDLSNTFSLTVYSGQRFRYEQNNLGMNVKVLTIGNSEYKSCTLEIDDSLLERLEGYEYLTGYDDVFNVTYNDLKSSYGDYTFISYGEPIKLTLNYSVYTDPSSYVEFSIYCSDR